MSIIKLTCFTLVIGLLLSLAAEPQKKADKTAPAAPADITADSVDYDMEIRQAIFQGNVNVVDERLNMTADRMIVDFDEKQKLTQIMATGQVVVTRAADKATDGKATDGKATDGKATDGKATDGKATGGKAVYSAVTGKVIMTLDPVLYLGGDQLVGAEQVVYDQKAGEFRTQGGRAKLKITLPANGEALK